MNSRRMLTTVVRRWWIVVITILIGTGVGYGVNQLLTPEYTATVRLFVSSTGGTSSTESYQGDQFSQQRTASYAHLLNSEQVSQRVIDELGLPMTADELAGHVKAEIVPRTVLLDVSVTNGNAQRAAEIANTLADQFITFAGPLETPRGQQEPRSTVTIVSQAEVPSSASFPRLSTSLLYGGLGGLAVGLLVVVLSAALTRKVGSTEELARIAGASAFGPVDVPARDTAERQTQLSGWRGGEAEGFRRLRVQIEAHDPAPQVVLVSSVSQGATGARFAADLAVAFAEAGRKTVLTGADGEFADVVASFGVGADETGLADAIGGQTAFGEVVHATPSDDLFVVPPGQSDDFESQLSSPAVSRFLDDLRKDFEQVVIVTASVNDSSGASVLSAMADADVLVVDRSKAKRRQVSRAVGELKAARAHLLGAVLVRSTK